MEDSCSGSDPVLEGVTFNVKYLGHCIVERASGEQVTAQAVKTIIAMVRYMLNNYVNDEIIS